MDVIERKVDEARGVPRNFSRGVGPDFFSHTFSIFKRGPKNFLIQISISREGGPAPLDLPPLVTPMFCFKIFPTSFLSFNREFMRIHLFNLLWLFSFSFISFAFLNENSWLKGKYFSWINIKGNCGGIQMLIWRKEFWLNEERYFKGRAVVNFFFVLLIFHEINLDFFKINFERI